MMAHEFSKMQFGMLNSPATFVCEMHKLLHGIDNVEIYTDDRLVHMHEWNEHFDMLKCLSQHFSDAGTALSKCLVGAHKVDFLG